MWEAKQERLVACSRVDLVLEQSIVFLEESVSVLVWSSTQNRRFVQNEVQGIGSQFRLTTTNDPKSRPRPLGRMEEDVLVEITVCLPGTCVVLVLRYPYSSSPVCRLL